ncbi:hypothetical protein HN803_04675 [candidate division WWE3 bacterium]|jgi:hypothetical protein|nr:hypothetical protein [candidate division WWE3 bacterium]
MYSQFVLVEFKNSCPYVDLFMSNDEITIETVAAYLIETEDFNEEKDAITFVDTPDVILLGVE